MIFFVIGCDEPDEIGLNFIDDQASVETSSYKLTAYTIPEDSVPTNYSIRNMLGFRNDPAFGSTKASIYSEFRLLENNLDLGENPVLDSVVLELYYAGYYGNDTTRQNVKIYELSENFPERTNGAYYSTLTIEHKPYTLADTLVRPIPNDSITVGESEYPPHLRIRLSDDFGQKLVDASGTEHFANNDAFIKYFKGLFITVDELEPHEEGAILYFNMLLASGAVRGSGIRLFYKTEGDTISRSRSFTIGDFSGRSTYIEHNYDENANELLKKQILENETSYGDSLLFLQAMAGTNVFIDFPKDSLEKLAQKSAVINSAKLVMPVDDHFNIADQYVVAPNPNRFYLLKNDEQGNLSHIIDSNHGYFGGYYDEDNNEYIINITKHFQELIKDPEKNYGMTLVIAESYNHATRVVLKGPGRTINPFRLELDYTVLD